MFHHCTNFLISSLQTKKIILRAIATHSPAALMYLLDDWTLIIEERESFDVVGVVVHQCSTM